MRTSLKISNTHLASVCPCAGKAAALPFASHTSLFIGCLGALLGVNLDNNRLGRLSGKSTLLLGWVYLRLTCFKTVYAASHYNVLSDLEKDVIDEWLSENIYEAVGDKIAQLCNNAS